MQLPDEAEGEGQILEPLDAVFEGDDVVGDLPEVRGTPLDARSRLRSQQFPERGLSALDAAGENRLPADERPDQEVGVGQPAARPRETAQEMVGLGECVDQLLVPLDPGGERIGDEGRVTFCAPDGSPWHLTLHSHPALLSESSGPSPLFAPPQIAKAAISDMIRFR